MKQSMVLIDAAFVLASSIVCVEPAAPNGSRVILDNGHAINDNRPPGEIVKVRDEAIVYEFKARSEAVAQAMEGVASFVSEIVKRHVRVTSVEFENESAAGPTGEPSPASLALGQPENIGEAEAAHTRAASAA